MAITVTSYTPTTGSALGGTTIVVTGTGLDTVKNVLVNNVPATIIGTPSPTSLTFKTPAGAVGAQPVRFLDSTTGDTTAATQFTYAAATGPEALITTLAKKYRVDVLIGGTTWTKVRGITDFKPTVAPTTADDSDYDSGIWGSDFKSQLKWQLALVVKRGQGATSGAYDPGQEALRALQDQTGAAGAIQARWYDRSAGPEAYTGTGIVTWEPQGGNATAADIVNVTIIGQGARTLITNPVIADPTLT